MTEDALVKLVDLYANTVRPFQNTLTDLLFNSGSLWINYLAQQRDKRDKKIQKISAKENIAGVTLKMIKLNKKKIINTPALKIVLVGLKLN